jgi:hypothetical protein
MDIVLKNVKKKDFPVLKSLAKQLEIKILKFFEICKEKNYPVESYCFIENETDFILEVKANWIDEMNSCSNALDILNDILWETTDAFTRREIFAISILDSNEKPHCYSEITQ